MKVLLILILLGMVVLFALRNNAPKQIGAAIYALLTVFAVVQGMVIYKGCTRSGASFIPSLHEVAGKILGELLVESFPDGGQVLVVLAGTEDPMNPGLSEKDRSQVKGLRTAFEGTGLTLTEYVVEPPEQGMQMVATGPMLSAGEFYGILARDRLVAAITGIGVPPLAVQRSADTPPIYLLESVHEHEGRRLIANGIVRGGVLLRSGADWSKKPGLGMSEADAFALRYVLVTPGDMGELADRYEE